MKKLDIIYEDKYIIVINKPANMLTISTDKIKEDTLYYKVSDYLKQKHKSNKVYIVHRLDRDTSGLVIFAKSQMVKEMLQNDWHNVYREYLAICYGKIENSKGTIKSFLKETKSFFVYESKNGGKLAITNYEKIYSNNSYTLLKIIIETGRKNQIRVQLKGINHPIVGDKKYNKEIDKGSKRLYLHANRLEFYHPITKEILSLKTAYPKDFVKLIKKEYD